jgi:hypothetical protein
VRSGRAGRAFDGFTRSCSGLCTTLCKLMHTSERQIEMRTLCVQSGANDRRTEHKSMHKRHEDPHLLKR